MNSQAWSRRQFLQTSAATLVASSLYGADFDSAQQEQKKQSSLDWGPAADLSVEGRGFADTIRHFDRLPGAAEQVVRKEVWNLSRMSAGMLIRFQTDSDVVHVRYDLLNERLAMPHMPATSVSGVDLYAEDDEGHMKWATVLKPQRQNIDNRLLGKIKPTSDGSARKFQLYLPLYNGVDNLEIGVKKGSRLAASPTREDKPVLFYGTSIMHGACASRSGMSIPAILGRRLDRPVINLGFSGNGRMEKEVGQFLCELDPAIFVIDCLPNMNANRVTRRCEPLVNQIRSARPDTPILLVEDRVFANAWLRSGAEEFHKANQAALRAAFDRLLAAGVDKLHYLPGQQLLGSDHDGTTDGSHPNDLGMMRYANAYEPVLRDILA